jgi:hypothetical protein
MFMLNDKPLGLDVPFTHNGIQYPNNWLRLASPSERAAIGITETADPQPYDDRFYWGLNNPKDLDQCKANMVAQVKAIAGSLLSVSDWKVVRAAEGVKPVDADTLAARAEIRDASNTNEEAIAACTTVDQLAALQLAWPSKNVEQTDATE